MHGKVGMMLNPKIQIGLPFSLPFIELDKLSKLYGTIACCKVFNFINSNTLCKVLSIVLCVILMLNHFVKLNSTGVTLKSSSFSVELCH